MLLTEAQVDKLSKKVGVIHSIAKLRRLTTSRITLKHMDASIVKEMDDLLRWWTGRKET